MSERWVQEKCIYCGKRDALPDGLCDRCYRMENR